jgi:hypothetical protein
MEPLKNFKLRENEKIDEIVYHHPMIMAPHLAVCLLILFLDFFMMYYLFLQGWWGAGLFVLVVVIVAFYIVRLFFLFRNNRLIVTNQRIIDFEQVSFFEKFVNEFSFGKIREARAIIKGIGPTLFRYGNLKLILEDEVGPFELYRVANPLKLQDKINHYLVGRECRPSSSDKESPVSLIMAQIRLLSPEHKEEIRRRLEAEQQEVQQ